MTRQESFKRTNERRKKLKERLRKAAKEAPTAGDYWRKMDQVIRDKDETYPQG